MFLSMIRVRVYTNKTPEEITDRSLVSDDGALLYRIVVASFFSSRFCSPTCARHPTNRSTGRVRAPRTLTSCRLRPPSVTREKHARSRSTFCFYTRVLDFREHFLKCVFFFHLHFFERNHYCTFAVLENIILLMVKVKRFVCPWTRANKRDSKLITTEEKRYFFYS